MKESITWKIGGEAGFGIMSSGLMLARLFSRKGYHVFSTNEYPSLIRGGHNLVTVRISTTRFEAMNKDVHILVALNKETVDLHREELSDSALVVFDPQDHVWNTGDFRKPITLLSMPLAQIVKERSGDPVMRNTVSLGVTVALLGIDFSVLEQIIHDQFKKKKQEIIDSNVGMAKAGYDYVKEHFSTETSMHIGHVEVKEKQLILNASEALGVGAARAGLKFAAIYPMTPINSLITYLADHAKQFGIVYKQPEDEIAGINMAIGASAAGVRSMVATSGGGFALMVEGISLAGITELPLVIDLGMRVGPATGMPTWTEQGELQFAIHAGHGEFPKIVLAPGDITETYELTVQAFNLADRYQIPVIILTDKYLNESHWCVSEAVFKKPVTIDRGKLLREEDLPADGTYKRYDLSAADGISPRAAIGMKHGFFYANSYEHDEVGHSTEKAEMRKVMAEKRLKKYEAIKRDIMPPSIWEVDGAEITFVCWGSSKGPVLEAAKLLRASGKKVNIVHYSWLYPFPSEQTVQALSRGGRIIAVENNSTGQLVSLIREHTGIVIGEKLLKFDGRPFYPEDIVAHVLAV